MPAIRSGGRASTPESSPHCGVLRRKAVQTLRLAQKIRNEVGLQPLWVTLRTLLPTKNESSWEHAFRASRRHRVPGPGVQVVDVDILQFTGLAARTWLWRRLGAVYENPRCTWSPDLITLDGRQWYLIWVVIFTLSFNWF